MNRKQLMTLLLVPAVAVALAGSFFTAEAQKGQGQRGDGEGRGGPPSIERMAERLDLTAEQQAQIEAFRENSEAERLELRKQTMQLKNQIEGEWLKNAPSESTLKNLTQQMGELRTRMQVRRVEHRLALREVLTDEQWDKLLTSREGRGRGHRGQGPKGGGHGNSGAGNWRDR
jgi:Spy/CpxP family protein refolding chaperone